MSVFDRVKKSKDGDPTEHHREWEKFQADFPSIAELFDGLQDDDNKWKFGPATIMFWMECGVMHVCCKPKFTTKVLFTTVPDPLMVFESLQDQLSKGHYEWKEGRQKR